MDYFQLSPEIIDIEQNETANSPISISKTPKRFGKKLKLPENCGLCGLDLSKNLSKNSKMDFIRHLYRKHKQIMENFQEEYGKKIFSQKINFSCPFENCSYVEKINKCHMIEHVLQKHKVVQRYYDEEILNLQNFQYNDGQKSKKKCNQKILSQEKNSKFKMSEQPIIPKLVNLPKRDSIPMENKAARNRYVKDMP